MRCRIMIPVLVCAVLGGCGASSGGEETRTIPLAHMKPDQALMLVEPYMGSLEKVRATERPAALTITASGLKLDQIQDLLRRYDVPFRNVRLRFQIIEADGFTTNDSAIAEVETALRQLFRFRGYRLIAEALAAGASGSVTSHQLIGPGDITLHLEVGVGQVSGLEDRKAVELNVELNGPRGTILRSGVTVPHGQTVVLGTARPFPNMGALILVVRPEIE
jgi:type II secretory pathway component GspD/PulD (secretin)